MHQTVLPSPQNITKPKSQYKNGGIKLPGAFGRNFIGILKALSLKSLIMSSIPNIIRNIKRPSRN